MHTCPENIIKRNILKHKAIGRLYVGLIGNSVKLPRCRHYRRCQRCQHGHSRRTWRMSDMQFARNLIFTCQPHSAATIPVPVSSAQLLLFATHAHMYTNTHGHMNTYKRMCVI